MKLFKIAALAALVACFAGASPASARVSVVAANEDLAWITQQVGGQRVSVDYIARGDQDPHRIEPRPSQVIKLARADVLVRIGMDLDLWLDSLIRAANNGKISPGGRGYVDASRGIHALEVPQGKLDPSKGDIHVYGNPHYLFAPSNVRICAGEIAAGLERVDPSGRGTYQANLEGLLKRVHEAIIGWNAKMAPFRGRPVVTYHKSLIYFLNEFGLREFGNVEPKPGLEPTPGHVHELAQAMKQAGVKVIIAEDFHPRRFSDLLARESGGRVVVIPGGVGAERITDYFTLMNTIIDRVAGALRG